MALKRRISSSQYGDAGRLIRTSLAKGRMAVPHAAQRPRHSARFAARFFVKLALYERLRSELKWLETEAWTGANNCKLRIRRKKRSSDNVLLTSRLNQLIAAK